MIDQKWVVSFLIYPNLIEKRVTVFLFMAPFVIRFVFLLHTSIEWMCQKISQLSATDFRQTQPTLLLDQLVPIYKISWWFPYTYGSRPKTRRLPVSYEFVNHCPEVVRVAVISFLKVFISSILLSLSLPTTLFVQPNYALLSLFLPLFLHLWKVG